MSSDTCRAFRITGRGEAAFVQLPVEELSPGDVLIRVEYSCINYKDALAATGAAPILRRYPLNGGIDAAGVVLSSSDARYAPGDRVVVTGAGLSETRDGGYASRLRMDGDALVPLPADASTYHAMQLGTAGFTAALAIHRLELAGQRASHGPVAVSGASGGVGSIAVDMLAGAGYEVTAFTGKASAHALLGELGAAQVRSPADLDLPGRALEQGLWAGAVDSVGGDLLAWLLATTRYGGNVAAVGLADTPELHTSVMPFILRGISLLGVNSVETPRALRLAVWSRIYGDLRPGHIDRIAARTIGLEDLPEVFQAYVDRKVTGRTVVAVDPAS